MTDFATAARPHRMVITLCMIVAPLLQTVDTTIANVALPHMRGSLSATSDQISWVLTSYLLSSAIATPAVGWLTGRFGRRTMFLLSMGGFTAASMLCGAAQTLEQMVAFRMVQGVFGASLVPLSQAVMVDLYEVRERGLAMSAWSVGVMVGPIIGPTLGAWLTENLDWRYVFYVNLPVGLLGFIGLWAFMPREGRDAPRRFDWLGFAALSLGIGGLQLLLDRGETKDWFDSPEIAIEATLSVLGFFVFLVQMLMAKAPFMHRGVFRDRNFVTCLGLTFTIAMAMNATSALLPTYFQGLSNYPVMLSGIAMAPRGFGTMLALPIAGYMVNRVEPRVMMIAGMGVLAFSTWAMTGWTPDTNISAQMPVVMMQGMTTALVFTPLQIVAFATLPVALRTECSGVMSLFRNMGGSIGVAVMETLLTRTTQVAHADLARFATPFNRALQNGAPGHFWDPMTRSGAALLDQLISYNAQIVGYRDVFLAMMMGMVPAAVLILTMRRPKAVVAVTSEDTHPLVD